MVFRPIEYPIKPRVVLAGSLFSSSEMKINKQSYYGYKLNKGATKYITQPLVKSDNLRCLLPVSHGALPHFLSLLWLNN